MIPSIDLAMSQTPSLCAVIPDARMRSVAAWYGRLSAARATANREDSRYEQVEGAMPDAWNRPRDADQRSLQCASPAAQICPYRHCDYGVHQNLPQGGEDDGSRLLVGLGEYPRGLLGNEKIPGDAQHQPDPHRQKEKTG